MFLLIQLAVSNHSNHVRDANAQAQLPGVFTEDQEWDTSFDGAHATQPKPKPLPHPGMIRVHFFVWEGMPRLKAPKAKKVIADAGKKKLARTFGWAHR